MSVDILPDDVLLGIFDFYMGHPYTKKEIEAWQLLVRVCQRWRSLVFGSPRRLNLQLLCEAHTQKRVRDRMDVWPALPLMIHGFVNKTEGSIYGSEDDVDGTEGGVDEAEELDNIIAALGRSDCVCQIILNIPSSFLECVSTAMQKPFPELTYMRLSSSKVETETVVPELFLGGSASPRLRTLQLKGIPIPGLPKLLLSATHLTTLILYDIPHSGYFSPVAMVTLISTLTGLSSLSFGFRSPLSRPEPESRRPPPLTRSVIPSLFTLTFHGVSEYLEDLVSRIDTPRLDSLNISMFNQIVFDTPQTIQFISRMPCLEAFKEAHLVFEKDGSRVDLEMPKRSMSFGRRLTAKTLCRTLDWQISSLEQVCTSCLPSLSALEDLYIYDTPQSPPYRKDNIEDALWLQLLSPFSCVKNLYLNGEYAQHIAPALQQLVGDRTTDVFPALENIFLDSDSDRPEQSGFVPEGIVKFFAARQLSDQPISILSFSLWHTKNDLSHLYEFFQKKM